MSITQDTAVFEGLHGKIQVTMPENRLQVSAYPGISGVSVMIGKPGQRMLSTSYRLLGDTEQELQDAITSINRAVRRLTGTVTVDGPFAAVFPKCTFLGFEPIEEGYYVPNLDQYMQRGRLNWIQRDPSGVASPPPDDEEEEL